MYKNKDHSGISTEVVLILYRRFPMTQFTLILIRMSTIPLKRQIILVNEIFSARPIIPIPVVAINIKGPTKANRVLI